MLKTDMKKWTAYVEQDGEDLIIPLPNDLMEELDWKVGDVLVWDVDELTGKITLTKKKVWWYDVIWCKIRAWRKTWSK